MNQHYFSVSPSGELRTREIEVELAGSVRRIVTAGGVFSPEHLDRGTEILLRTIEGIDGTCDGAMLDLGCGWGPIALAGALECPQREVWAVDVNERSLALTRENATRLELENVHTATPAEVPDHIRFAEIRSNPPIRVGKEALHGLLRHWLPRLEVDGVARLVVAKHLGAESLQRWIGAEFPEFSVARIARDRGFHVIEARG